VRNFAQNKEIIFMSRLNLVLNSSHPALIDRLEAIEALIRDRMRPGNQILTVEDLVELAANSHVQQPGVANPIE